MKTTDRREEKELHKHCGIPMLEDKIIEIVYQELDKLTISDIADGGLEHECRERIAATLDNWYMTEMEKGSFAAPHP